MLISQTALVALKVAEEAAGDPPINPWIIGGGMFGILALLLLGLVLFGGGRDHT